MECWNFDRDRGIGIELEDMMQNKNMDMLLRRQGGKVGGLELEGGMYHVVYAPWLGCDLEEKMKF